MTVPVVVKPYDKERLDSEGDPSSWTKLAAGPPKELVTTKNIKTQKPSLSGHQPSCQKSQS